MSDSFTGRPTPLSDAEVLTLRQMIAERQVNVAELEAENARLRGLLSIALCPNRNICDDGVLTLGGDIEPCQWCEETKEALKEAGDE